MAFRSKRVFNPGDKFEWHADEEGAVLDEALALVRRTGDQRGEIRVVGSWGSLL